ncbi:MAG: DUF5720 family protein [Clostridiales bacterium]|nr:DUF5720 family protein [Clostridiales bacterium]
MTSIKEQLRQPWSGKEITGHGIMDIARFSADTRHMIVFDVLTVVCPVGEKGKRVRIFLTDEGYANALESEGRGEMKIVRHARVRKGDIFYTAPEHDHEIY